MEFDSVPFYNALVRSMSDAARGAVLWICGRIPRIRFASSSCVPDDILMPRMSGLELVGHVANRLQAALYREVVYLIEHEVLAVADSDAAVCWGPGLRWGLTGPNLLFHLAGGEGGIQHFMEYLSGPVATWWKDLGTITEFSPEVKQTIVNGLLKEANGRSISELEQERDSMLLELLATRSKAEEALPAKADTAAD
jgi:3-hydroxyacyl-CoA dehydrogenase